MHEMFKATSVSMPLEEHRLSKAFLFQLKRGEISDCSCIGYADETVEKVLEAINKDVQNTILRSLACQGSHVEHVREL